MGSDCFHKMFVSKLALLASELTNAAQRSRFFLRKMSWISFFDLLCTPAVAPVSKSLQTASLLPDWLLAMDAGQITSSSWLQQTGNAPQQVTLQALFQCVAGCSRGKTRLINVAPSFHLLPQCLLFSGKGSSRGAEP